MTNGERRRFRQCLDVLVGIVAAWVWVFAERNLDSTGRFIGGASCILAAIYCGWRLEHYRTHMKRTDATMVALYGAALLQRGGAERLRKVFTRFLEKKKSFDRWGCTTLMLSDEVSDELSSLAREEGKAPK